MEPAHRFLLAGLLATLLASGPAPASPGPQSRQIAISKAYLLLPVAPSAPKSVVEVWDNGGRICQFNATLATASTDSILYWASLDTRPFRGHTITLNVSSLTDEGFAMIQQSDFIPGREAVGSETYRPKFHFTCETGWNNDPNGLLYHNGEWHMFCQNNPYGTGWDNMSWYHAVSRDLMNWDTLPLAIHSPSLSDMAFSGGGAVDSANSAGWKTNANDVLIATWASTGRGQCVSYSTDNGRTFTEYSGNPVVTQHGDRDPKPIWYEYTGNEPPEAIINPPSTGLNGHWVMVVYGNGAEFHVSPDLKTWQYVGSYGDLFECPEFFPLPVDGNVSSNKWVLFGGNAQYEIGSFNGRMFTPDAGGKQILHHGPFYASQVFSNGPAGRRVQVGWMQLSPPAGATYNQMMSLPMELSLRTTTDGVRMFAEPVAEISSVYGNSHAVSNVALSASTSSEIPTQGKYFDIAAEFEPGTATRVGLLAGGNQVASYDVSSHLLNGSYALSPVNGRIALRVVIDEGIMETFANHGRIALHGGFSPVATASVTAYAQGGNAQLVSFAVHEITPNTAPVASQAAISGTANQGQTMAGSCTFADAENDAEGPSTFRWFRSLNEVFDLTASAIAGATSSTYVVQADDVGGYLFFEVTPVAATGKLTGKPVRSATAVFVNVPGNARPVANTQTLDANEDTPLAIILTGSDTDQDPLTFAVSAQAVHGTLSGSPPNLSYLPNHFFIGTDSFAFKANDGKVDSAAATVTITVHGVPGPPTADPQGVRALLNTPLTIILTGADPVGDPLVFTVLTGPAHGTLTGTAPDLTYTPTADYLGNDSFTFKTNDGTDDSPPATVGIEVDPLPITFTFAGGTGQPDWQGWTVISQNNTGSGPKILVSSRSERGNLKSPPVITTRSDTDGGSFNGDSGHPVLIARSPSFQITSNLPITFESEGGSITGSIIPNLGTGDYTSNAMGACLVRADTGQRVTAVHTAQENNRGTYQLDSSPFLNDGKRYCLEVVDNFSGGWGYVEWDTFVIPRGLAASTYLLTVTSGSGGGFFSGTDVATITAAAPPTGQEFEKWVVNSGSPSIADIHATNTTLTLGTADATLTATYRISGSTGSTLLAYEGFNYASGYLAGQTGGSGWSGAWTGVAGANATVMANGLAAGANAPAGYDGGSLGKAAFQPSAGRIGRWLDTTAGGPFGGQGYLDSSGRIGATGKRLYLSFLQQPNTTSSFYEFEFHRGDLGDGGRIGGIGNDVSGGTNVNLRAPNSVNNLSLGVGSTAVNFYVVRIDFQSGNDDIRVYRNPSSYSEPTTPDLTKLGQADMSFNGISFGAYINSTTVAHDEIRIGQTWADVMPAVMIAPPTPTGLTTTTGNARTLLVWTAAAGATAYKVNRAQTNGGPYRLLATVSTQQFLDTTAANGTTYYYVVSAANPAGNSANSAQVAATPTLPAVPTGTVAYYSFDDSNNLGHDDSGNPNDLTGKTGAPQFSATGRFGGALYLDGSTTLGTVSGWFPTGVPTGASPYTVACFVKADPTGSASGGWIGYGSGANRQANNFRLDGYFGGVHNYWWNADISAAVPNGGDFRSAWHAVAGTWDGATRKIYIDGLLQASDTPGDPAISTANFRVGTTLADENFKGWIDELLIVNRALTATEVGAYALGAYAVGPLPQPGSYAAWAAANAAGADPAADSNHNGIPNGVEFFMGATAANPATMPPLVNTSGVLTWTIPHNPTAAASFKFQISDDLSVSGWTNVALPDPRISILTNPTGVRITLPADAAKKFCRLVVAPD